MQTVGMIVLVVWMSSALPLLAQPRGQPASQPATPAPPRTVDAQPTKEERVTRVYALRNAEAEAAARVILELKQDPGEMRVAADSRTNSVIVSATPTTLNEVEATIALLDKQEAAPRPAPDLRVYKVQNTPVNPTLQAALLMGLPPVARVTVDPARSIVLVLGDAATHAKVKDLLAELDTAVEVAKPARSYRVKITWLIDASQAPKDPAAPAAEAPELPADLKPVLEELKKIGIKEVRVAARTMVRSTTANPFSLMCKADIGEPCDLSLEGDITASEGARGPRLRVQLTGRQTRTVATIQPAPNLPQQSVMERQEIVGIRTTIIAPAGHPVILGVSPTDKLTSIFVVTVDED